MLTNLHTHTSFCDGKSTPEEMILSAIEKGFGSIGFSGHGHTSFDESYCITDTDGYIAEIKRLKEKYSKEIQVYLGAEEDMLDYVKREDYDYIIGSSHYIYFDGKYLEIDGDSDTFQNAAEQFGGDYLALADMYYKQFSEYIVRRKPDIVGHFDLVTKYDEKYFNTFLNNPEYDRIAEKYFLYALESQCIFEVNTGAIFRGYRTMPYPKENLLHILKKENGKITFSADAHCPDALDFKFSESARFLWDIGFREFYGLYDGKFRPFDLKSIF